MVDFLCQVYGPDPDTALEPNDLLPRDLIPPAFDPEPGDDLGRRLVSDMIDRGPFSDYLKINIVNILH